MATEARDVTTEAPERINPVPENVDLGGYKYCLLYTSPSPRDS